MEEQKSGLEVTPARFASRSQLVSYLSSVAASIPSSSGRGVLARESREEKSLRLARERKAAKKEKAATAAVVASQVAELAESDDEFNQ